MSHADVCRAMGEFHTILRDNVLAFFPPEQVFVIALEERARGEQKDIKSARFAADLHMYLLGNETSASQSTISNRVLQNNVSATTTSSIIHQRKLLKTDTVYPETVNYCHEDNRDELQALQAWGSSVQAGLMKLHDLYKGRWARFPIDAISRYGKGDYCSGL